MDNITGQCKTCLIETENPWYVFCSINCQAIWYWAIERPGKALSKGDIDIEVYKRWLEEKIITIEAMTTREDIEKRIEEIRTIEFFAKREWMLLHQQWDKINGRKGIAPWLKAERDKLITDPDIKVNWEGEPRPKKEKKPKQDMVKNLLGFDIKELTQELKNSMKDDSPKPNLVKEVKEKEDKPQSMDDAIAFLMSGQSSEPKEEKPKASEEEIKNKANALKEKMRLAKLAK